MDNLDRSFQEMPGFFETWVENLETPAPSPAVRSLTRKKKRNRKLPPLGILTNIPQTIGNSQKRRNFISIMENIVILWKNVLCSRP